MNNVWKMLAAALIAAGLGACSQSDNTGENAGEAGEGAVVEAPQLEPDGDSADESLNEEMPQDAETEVTEPEPQSEPEPEPQLGPETEPEPAATEPQPEEQSEQPTDGTGAGDTSEKLKNENLLNLTEEEVTALYGEAQATTNEMNYLIWRYDFGAGDYKFGEKVIAIDTAGFSSGNMLAQLTVEFGDDNVVDAYNVFYMKNDELMQYRVTKDGAEEYSAAAD